MRVMLFGCRSAVTVTALAVAVAIFTAASAPAQPAQLGPPGPVTTPGAVPPEPREKHYQAAKQFYQQRAYPFDKIPPNAYQNARQYYDQTWGPASRQASVNVNGWTSIGPAPIVQTGWNRFFGVFNQSGRITTVALHPTNPNILYIGGAQGGVP